MNCLKCGRETSDDHVFCDSCRETMKKYPVRPGTAVILPRHKEGPAVKKTRRHVQVSPQDQVKKLKKQRSRLRIMVFVLILALAASIVTAVHYWRDPELKPGQNYAVAETTAPAP